MGTVLSPTSYQQAVLPVSLSGLGIRRCQEKKKKKKKSDMQVTWRWVAVRELPKDVLQMASGLISPSGLAGHRRQLCIGMKKISELIILRQ